MPISRSSLSLMPPTAFRRWLVMTFLFSVLGYLAVHEIPGLRPILYDLRIWQLRATLFTARRVVVTGGNERKVYISNLSQKWQLAKSLRWTREPTLYDHLPCACGGGLRCKVFSVSLQEPTFEVSFDRVRNRGGLFLLIDQSAFAGACEAVCGLPVRPDFLNPEQDEETHSVLQHTQAPNP